MNEEIPNSIILDQYGNPNNPLAHYRGTAEEIIADCGDWLDLVVIGAGTGGTLTGVSKRLKERYPNVLIVGVDPKGSILSFGNEKGVKPGGKTNDKYDVNTTDTNDKDDVNTNDTNVNASTMYQVEGIGYDFIPRVLDYKNVDCWITCNDRDSFHMSRELIRKEGLLCGGSSGSAVWAALEAVKNVYKFANDPGKRVLVILPDSVRNYMSKFLSDEWMESEGFSL